MRGKNLFYLIILSLVLFSGCIKHNQPAGIDRHNDEAEIIVLLNRMIDAFTTRIITEHEDIWWKSDSLKVFGAVKGAEFHNWTEFRNHLLSTVSSMSSVSFTVECIEVQVLTPGQSAHFMMIVNQRFFTVGKEVNLNHLRYSGALKKINGKWKITAFHGSLPSEPFIKKD
ncbi:MAG: nuclear transport factor 2 family protein [Ignavibacteriaceae bacterium]|nr:nuclear transport factor 2 family protein [Ignavibacteriaceae bacterium]